MSSASIAAAGKANRRVDASIRRLTRKQPLALAIARVAGDIWPDKTDIELSIRTGTSDRRCRELLGARAGLSADALAGLLHSDDGFLFLEAAMGDATPTWWRAFKRQARLSNVRRTQEELRLEIERLERSAADLSD